MKRRTWLRLNVGPCNAHAYERDETMDDGLKKIYEEEEMKKVMETNTKHELEMMRQARQAEGPLFKDIDPVSGSDWNEERMDIIGQNGNDGEHYPTRELSDYEKKYGQDGTVANNMAIASMYFSKNLNQNLDKNLNRGNWWGLADDWDESDEIEASKKEDDAKYTDRNKEPEATGMEEDPPSAAEDCARQRGNYEL